jgi:NAD(P)-dependent dehydrogenase (short-subunit alcohol dehydrogenase family)
MDLELKDKVAVVTGASKGIGLAVVRELAAEGALVVAGARTPGSLAEIDRVTPFAVDLSEPDGPPRLVQHAVDRHRQIDVLVNNVGAAHVRLGSFLDVSDADFEASLQLNFFAALRATRAAAAAMIERGAGGTIVNVASVNSFFEPDSGVMDYGAAKAALVNLAKSLSQELGPKGIRVTSVSPGQVATDLWLGDRGVAATVGQATGHSAEEVREQATAAIATGRFSTPEEVATLVTLLASPRTANVTGANWVIDGGLIKTT